MEISSVIIRTIATYNSMIYVVSHVKSNLFEKINIAKENNTIRLSESKVYFESKEDGKIEKS
jgi:hypothetical protein